MLKLLGLEAKPSEKLRRLSIGEIVLGVALGILIPLSIIIGPNLTPVTHMVFAAMGLN